MVNNAAAAVIRQMIITLFERVSDEQESSTSSTKAHTSDALSILREICAKLNSSSLTLAPEAPACLDLSKIDRPFALDLVESVMSNHGNVFRAEPAFAEVIKTHLCPLIVSCFEEGDKRGDFARTCRLWRLARLIVCDFSDLMTGAVQNFFALWSLILKDAKSSAWEKAAVLEILKTILCSSLLLESVYSVCQDALFKDALEAALQLMSAILAAFPNEGLVADQKNSVLNQFDKPTPPSVTQNYLLLLGFEAFTGWASNLVATVRGLTAKPAGHFFAPIRQFETSRDRDMQMAAQLLKLVGPRFAAILLHLRTQSVEPLAHLLTLFAVFEQKNDLDLLLKALMPFVLPEPLAADAFALTSALQGGNGLLMQMTLECGKDLAELLQDSWIWIVRLQLGLAQLSLLKERKVLSTQLPFNLDQLKVADEAILNKSDVFSEAAFTFLVQAHCTLIGEGLNHEPCTSSLLLLLKRLQMILVLSFKQRIVEAEETSVAWDCLTGTLISAGRSREFAVRLTATEILGRTNIQELIKYAQMAKFKSNKSLQIRVLQPIARLVNSSEWPDLSKSVLDALLALIGALGEGLLEEGWLQVYTVCHEALNIAQKLNDPSTSSGWDESDEPTKESGGSIAAAASLYRAIHDLIKASVADNLSCMSLTTIDGLAELIAALGRIKLTAEEVNIPLNAVRYLWDISDYLASLKGPGEAEMFASWLKVLKHLAVLGLDTRPELRNSAVQTMLRTANMNGAVLKAHWTAVLDEWLFPFLHDLRESSAKISSNEELGSPITAFAHFSRDSAAKQWHETESASLNGFTQILQSHQQVLTALPEWPRYWRAALGVFELYVIKSQAEELVSVAVASLLSLAGSFALIEGCSPEMFTIWKRINEEMGQNCQIPFCQESLLKLAKVPLQLSSLLASSMELATCTLDGLSTILQYATPNDPVRDTENPSELQRFYCTILLDELSKIFSYSLLIEEVSKWIILARSTTDPTFATFTFGYPSLRSRQSTASSNKSVGAGSTNLAATSPGPAEYSFIGLAAWLIPRSVGLIDECCSQLALEGLLRACGKYMKAKFKCPGRLETPLWLLSTEAFQATIKKLPCARKLALWSTILVEMRSASLACKNMFAMGADWAEEVDCGWFAFMRVEIIPNLEGVLIDDLVALLIELARITKFLEFDENVSFSAVECDFKFPSGVGPVPVAVKEKFCFGAYELVIELALKGSSQALDQLTSLTELHLKAFIKDRRVLGPRFPLSRLRILELSSLLKGCLRIPGSEHLKGLAELVIEVQGHPAVIINYCRRILKRLNGIEEAEDEEPFDSPAKDPVKRTHSPIPFPRQSQTPIVLHAESQSSSSPVPKRSFSEAIIQNFRSMELFDSGE